MTASTQNDASAPRNPGFRPGRWYVWLRRLTQGLVLLAVVVAPFLGGWQRLDRVNLASWDSEGRELPEAIRTELPMGEAPSQAYEAIELVGGGTAARFFDVPAMDPVAGTLSLLSSPPTLWTLLALAIPLVLAVLAGRVFCGWLCPFGTVARTLDALLALSPWRPSYLVPSWRPLRWILLVVAVVAALFGSHLLLYLALPHLLVHQTVYSLWLLGGGGAVLGVLGGLLLAGLVFGPTTYCASLCPTGAALGALSHRRVVRLNITQPSACGPKCRLCSQSCWLDLDPASGDPGPDCDVCTRCFTTCPKTNLQISWRRPKVEKPIAAAMLLATAAAAGLLSPGTASARDDQKPRLVLEAEDWDGDRVLAVEIVDNTGVHLAADSDEALSGIELSVFVARGERGEADERGLIPSRDVYQGPLRVRLLGADGRTKTVVEFQHPNSPASTPTRSIYRHDLAVRMFPGDRVVIDPVEGWIDEEVAWTLPPPGVESGAGTMLSWALAAALVFAGLLSLALAIRRPAWWPGRERQPTRKLVKPRRKDASTAAT